MRARTRPSPARPIRRPRRRRQPPRSSPASRRPAPRPSPSSTAAAAESQNVVIPGNSQQFQQRRARRGAGRSRNCWKPRGMAPSRRSPPDGTRAVDAIRASAQAAGQPQADAPRIAIVIGGLGISAVGHRRCFRQAAGAGDASRFAPYGTDRREAGGRARAANSTRCCCRSRWSRSTIPTTIPARRRC